MSFNLSKYESDFPHRNLLFFKRGALTDLNNKEPIYKHYKPIIGELAGEIYQNCENISDSVNETTKVLYSIQDVFGHNAILIAGMDDDWIDKVFYYSFDIRGKYVDYLVLYENGGDGGLKRESFGNFLNSSTYEKTTINCEYNFENEENNCDTLITRYSIRADGTIIKLP